MHLEIKKQTKEGKELPEWLTKRLSRYSNNETSYTIPLTYYCHFCEEVSMC